VDVEGDKKAADNARKWGDGGTATGRRKIHWDEEAVDKLLDRNFAAEETKVSDGVGEGHDERKGGLSELFQSFKVARFASMQEESEADAAAQAEDSGVVKGDYDSVEEVLPENTNKTWQELLEGKYKEMVAEETQKMGKGKRERKAVVQYDEPILGTESWDDESMEGGSDSEGGEEDGGPNKKRVRKGDSGLLLGRGRNGKLLVYGFTESQRKITKRFLEAFGLMGGDWLAFYDKLIHYHKSLGHKSMEEVKHYVGVVLKHLYASEEGGEGGTEFGDGVPKESLDCAALRKRLGLLDVIYRKVHQFEDRPPEEFSIDEGRMSRWSRHNLAVTNRSTSTRFSWEKSQDLLLLRLTLEYGFGNWKAFLNDEDFLAAFPFYTPVTVDESSNGGAGGGASSLSAAAAATDPPAPQDGSCTGSTSTTANPSGAEDTATTSNTTNKVAEGGDGEGELHGGPVDKTSIQMINLISKRMKVLRDALLMEKGREMMKSQQTRKTLGQARGELEQNLTADRGPVTQKLEELLDRRKQLASKMEALRRDVSRLARDDVSLRAVCL